MSKPVVVEAMGHAPPPLRRSSLQLQPIVVAAHTQRAYRAQQSNQSHQAQALSTPMTRIQIPVLVVGPDGKRSSSARRQLDSGGPVHRVYVVRREEPSSVTDATACTACRIRIPSSACDDSYEVHYRHDGDNAHVEENASSANAATATAAADGTPKRWHLALSFLARAKAQAAEVHITLRRACGGGEGFVVGLLAAHALAQNAFRKGLKHAVPSIQRALREARLHGARSMHSSATLIGVPNPSRPHPRVMAFARRAAVLSAWQERHVNRVWSGGAGWGEWGDVEEEEEDGVDRSSCFCCLCRGPVCGRVPRVHRARWYVSCVQVKIRQRDGINNSHPDPLHQQTHHDPCFSSLKNRPPLTRFTQLFAGRCPSPFWSANRYRNAFGLDPSPMSPGRVLRLGRFLRLCCCVKAEGLGRTEVGKRRRTIGVRRRGRRGRVGTNVTATAGPNSPYIGSARRSLHDEGTSSRRACRAAAVEGLVAADDAARKQAEPGREKKGAAMGGDRHSATHFVGRRTFFLLPAMVVPGPRRRSCRVGGTARGGTSPSASDDGCLRKTTRGQCI